MSQGMGTRGALADAAVELATGTVKYQPGPDLVVYSPSAAPVAFQRIWFSRLAIDFLSSPGLAGGWAHNFDLSILPSTVTGSWEPLTYVRPDGTRDTLDVEVVDGTPTGKLLPPVGSAYLASGQPGYTTGEWDYLEITDKAQNVQRFEWHDSGVYALVSLTNRMGQATLFAWDDDRLLQTITDDATDTVLLTLSYTDGYLSRIADAYGRKVDYAHRLWTGEGYSGECTGLAEVSVISPVDEDDPLLAYAYDYLEVPGLDGYHYGDKLLLLTDVSIPSPTGAGLATGKIRYYNTNYRAEAGVDANGIQTVYAYGDGYTVVSHFDANNEYVDQYQADYNENGDQTASTCSGCASETVYDDPDNPRKATSVTAPDGKVTSFTHDEFGNVLTVTDPRENVTTNTYDYDDFALGRLVTVERTSDSVTKTLAEYTYDSDAGLVLTVTTPKPGTTDGSTVTTTNTYDDLGNVLTVAAPGNDTAATITTTYDYGETPEVGQPLSVTDNLDHTTTFTYDSRANRTSVEDALGNVWTTLYNLADQVTESWQPATGQQGSGHGRVVNEYLYPGGPRTEVTVYDEGGSVVQHINYTFGLEGELLAVTGGTEEVHYTYDARYRKISLTDGNGVTHTTTFGYNSKGRLALIRYPLADPEEDEGNDTVRFTLYDDAGRLLTRVDGNDVTTEYTYDEPGGALTLIHYPADSSLDVSFDYDSLGRRTSTTNNEGTLDYTYDDRGAPLSVTTTYTDLDPQEISWTYNDDGSRHTMTTPGGTETYAYDGGQRMTSLDYGLGTAAWEWLDNGWLSKQTLPNEAYTDYGYNDAGQLNGLANKAPDDSEISTYGTMAYRGTGDLSTVTSAIPGATSLEGEVDYSYDTKRELTEEESDRNSGYDYANVFDAAGNPTTFRSASSRTYNADNQLTGPGTYVYDGNGNPTTWDSTTLTWDFENRLTAYGALLTAGYRGDGLRAWKEADSVRTYFLYDGINIVCELDDEGALVADSAFGAAGLLSRGAVQYQFDPLGDAVHLLDGDAAVIANRLWDAWGNELTSGSDPRGYRARYGYCTDAETGLVALAYRYFAPQMGRFLNRDPAGRASNANSYRYAGNSPSAKVDLPGLTPVSIAPGPGFPRPLPPVPASVCTDCLLYEVWPALEHYWDVMKCLGPLCAVANIQIPTYCFPWSPDFDIGFCNIALRRWHDGCIPIMTAMLNLVEAWQRCAALCRAAGIFP